MDTIRQTQRPMFPVAEVPAAHLAPVDFISRATWVGVLRYCVQRSGMDDYEIADKLGISHGYMAKVLRGTANLSGARLTRFMAITPRGARIVCMRLVDKEQLYIVPMTSPREFSLDAAYADKVKPEPREEDDGQPLRITRPAGTWERKHAHLMARPTWFEGVAP